MSLRIGVSRRSFLKWTSAAAGWVVTGPAILPASALGADGVAAPSERITLGVIGYGPRCQDVLGHFMTFNDVRCLAVCDARTGRRNEAKARVDAQYKSTDCKTYGDLREMLAREDIDAVLIATGDRWHALASILTAKAGKDVYCEKPITLTIAEGRALVETVSRYGIVYQAGHQRRSVDSYRFQVEAVRKGMIGKLQTIICRVWEGGSCAPEAPQPVPPGFDYDMWLGPTPYHPYTNARVAMWNDFWDTGGGSLIGMGCHYTDIAQWGHNSDATGPIDYEGEATFNPDSFSEMPITAEIRCTYADGVKILLQSRGAFADRFIRFVGTDGWIQVDDETNKITAQPESILKQRSISARSWAHVGDHVRNFLDCIKTREQTTCPPEAAHRATTIGHAANLCIRLGRKLTWDPQRELFDDGDANSMISRAMRAPWHL